MFAKIYDKSLSVFTSWDGIPDHLHTRNQWKRLDRKVCKGEEPIALVEWQELSTVESEHYAPDGTMTTSKHKVLAPRQVALFGEEQTAPYRASLRTQAMDIFREYFVRFTSPERHIWWWPECARWLTCHGPLRTDQLRDHLNGKARHGVRGGTLTRFGGIDHDLHEGDPDIFLRQFRVLLAEFHGQDGWHFQVADENAGGVHLLQAFRGPVLLASYRMRLRQRLERLDAQHPELAARARAAGMKTLGELEIYPDTQRGFRLPLCEGRTMLLEKPLELVFNERLKRPVPNVLRYITWLTLDEKPYMPAEDVFEYVKARLKARQPAKLIVAQTEARSQKRKSAQAPTQDAPGGLGSLGKMKGRYAQVLADFWSGRLQVPDTLNIGIRLLALPLPYYRSEEEAVELIESYIDDLPDYSFSDRLSAGDRSEVSRIVRNTVRQVYDGNGGQPDPDLSAQKLKATVAAWQRRGFDPTDRSTWGKVASGVPVNLAKDFCWEPEEVMKLGTIQKLLSCPRQTASEAVKHFLRLVKAHTGEIAIPFVQRLLEGFGIHCGHHGKVNKFLAVLHQWDWIRVTAWERWHQRKAEGETRKGRARTYAIGEAMQHKFEDRMASGGRSSRAEASQPTAVGEWLGCPLPGWEKKRNLFFTSHHVLSSPSASEGERLLEEETLADAVLWSSLLTEIDIERNKGSP